MDNQAISEKQRRVDEQRTRARARLTVLQQQPTARPSSTTGVTDSSRPGHTHVKVVGDGHRVRVEQKAPQKWSLASLLGIQKVTASRNGNGNWIDVGNGPRT